jgi:site-specific recombinase XerC
LQGKRSTPFTKPAVCILKAWLFALPSVEEDALFATTRGIRLSADNVQYLVKNTLLKRTYCSIIRRELHTKNSNERSEIKQ